MAPSSSASRQNSSINRVLPAPGSPKITTGFASPEQAARHASITAESSAERPAKQLNLGAFKLSSMERSEDVSRACASRVPLLSRRESFDLLSISAEDS